MTTTPTADQPTPESVWDYPRPPLLVEDARTIRVIAGAADLVNAPHSLVTKETSHPPTYYISEAFVALDRLEKSANRSICEFKGEAVYWRLKGGTTPGRGADIGWSYPAPWGAYEALRGHFAFYAGRVDACFVGDEQVQAQDGDFYGGWITRDVVGPFKGGPGTRGW